MLHTNSDYNDECTQILGMYANYLDLSGWLAQQEEAL